MKVWIVTSDDYPGDAYTVGVRSTEALALELAQKHLDGRRNHYSPSAAAQLIESYEVDEEIP